jgi:hypothetical protein
VDAVPGFVPRVLRDQGVGLSVPRNGVRRHGGWLADPDAGPWPGDGDHSRRGVGSSRGFERFTGEYPWRWRPVDVEDFLAERRCGPRPITLTTLRADSNAVAMFCAYLTPATVDRSFVNVCLVMSPHRFVSNGIHLDTPQGTELAIRLLRGEGLHSYCHNQLRPRLMSLHLERRSDSIIDLLQLFRGSVTEVLDKAAARWTIDFQGECPTEFAYPHSQQ